MINSLTNRYSKQELGLVVDHNSVVKQVPVVIIFANYVKGVKTGDKTGALVTRLVHSVLGAKQYLEYSSSLPYNKAINFWTAMMYYCRMVYRNHMAEY